MHRQLDHCGPSQHCNSETGTPPSDSRSVASENQCRNQQSNRDVSGTLRSSERSIRHRNSTATFDATSNTCSSCIFNQEIAMVPVCTLSQHQLPDDYGRPLTETHGCRSWFDRALQTDSLTAPPRDAWTMISSFKLVFEAMNSIRCTAS